MLDAILLSLEWHLMATVILTNTLSSLKGGLPNPTALCCLEESSEATRVIKHHAWASKMILGAKSNGLSLIPGI